MVSLTRQDAFTCCSSDKFADLLASAGPFADANACIDTARRIWWEAVSVPDWLEAFAAHPMIGDAESLKKKYGAFGAMSQTEQSTALQTFDPSVFQVGRVLMGDVVRPISVLLCASRHCLPTAVQPG